MAAASKLAGYSLAQGDLLRRAMGKKDKEKMAKERKNFIEGCARTNKIPEKKANAIFDLLEKFAGYGFNKSHAAAYAMVAGHPEEAVQVLFVYADAEPPAQHERGRPHPPPRIMTPHAPARERRSTWN